MTDQEKIAALEAERDALAALVAEKDAALKEIVSQHIVSHQIIAWKCSCSMAALCKWCEANAHFEAAAKIAKDALAKCHAR